MRSKVVAILLLLLGSARADYPCSIVDGVGNAEEFIGRDDFWNNEMNLIDSEARSDYRVGINLGLQVSQDEVSLEASVEFMNGVDYHPTKARGSRFPILRDDFPFRFDRIEEIIRNGLISVIVEATEDHTNARAKLWCNLDESDYQ